MGSGDAAGYTVGCGALPAGGNLAWQRASKRAGKLVSACRMPHREKFDVTLATFVFTDNRSHAGSGKGEAGRMTQAAESIAQPDEEAIT
jgi:hypothetical protein